MTGTRDGAITRAQRHFDSGAFVDRLAQLVAVQTESHPPERKSELERYCHEVFGPMAAALGFETKVLDNPDPVHGPVLVASRIEDPSLPTVLFYGHGDVVRAMPERWRAGLDPWRLTVEGDRIYGRGTVDNKGQHLLGLDALGAVMDERGGRLGFNAKIMVETGEEAGSPGLLPFIRQHKDLLAADVFIALDGPRVSRSVPDVTLGTRGGIAMDLVVNLREGGHHSGHWGGLLKDAGVILSHAIASIISRDGRILVPGWTPAQVPGSVQRAAKAVKAESLPGAPVPEADWGEPGLSASERIYAWSSAIVLASISGQPESPVNAVGGTARARIQLRHTVDVNGDEVVPALRAHLAAQGFHEVEVVPVTERDMFQASRTDPDEPWVRAVVASFARTAGQSPNIIPNIGASGPSEFFRKELGVPVIWIPHSYGGCGQHGPDEHGLGTLFRDGLGLMAGLWWDIGERGRPG
ncbi:M20/M25/M40 family metallo-hydrolase [Roseomonas xinghualingensis]|uniref:M20/M25/M40 family metallo-hydrolase n=1 Tax=Roseomonas xinghualingensis TaxID=2986475 RepID=UPI0021F0C03C|nr:M20/M25/M40 family metallo-hydrolase [Roseomonas sp. SXEYE001]MCV4207814.1 M20/M25/M40 family metallo-hydrolase [Roseomonas sp. SXEYE001]